MSEELPTLVEKAPENPTDTSPQPDLGFLWDFWYPALRSDEIYGKHLAKAMLLEVPLVLGRTTEGKAFAMRDSCPHRGMPLHSGKFDGEKQVRLTKPVARRHRRVGPVCRCDCWASASSSWRSVEAS